MIRVLRVARRGPMTARIQAGAQLDALILAAPEPIRARRTAEGKTKTEIMRCLKRYIAREAFPYLLVAAPDALLGPTGG